MVLDYVVASTNALVKQQLEAQKQMWETVAQRPDLTAEQRAQVVKAFEDYR